MPTLCQEFNSTLESLNNAIVRKDYFICESVFYSNSNTILQLMALYTQIHIYSKRSLLMACQGLCSLVWDLWRGFWIFPVDPTPLGQHISFTRRERECHTEATGKGVLGKQRSQGQQWEGGSKSDRTEPRLRSTLTTSRGRHHPGALVVSKGNNSKGRWVKQRDSYPEDAALLCQEHWLPRQFGGRTGTTSP